MSDEHHQITIQPLTTASPHPIVMDCPPDKSITHRAIIFASMAKGRSEIVNPLLGADCRSTMAAFTALGVTFSLEEGVSRRVRVDSPGWDGWVSPLTPLDFGNSGTTARLLAGVFAATPGLFVSAFGDESLSQRPMGRVVSPLRQAGATVIGRQDGRFLPLAIRGEHLTCRAHTTDKASAQVKSALLLAGLNTPGQTSVTLPIGGRDHTERMLCELGATVAISQDGSLETISVTGPFRPAPRFFSIPGDPSSAAFFVALGALRPAGQLTLRRVLVNPTRTGFLEVLRSMGASVEASVPRRGDGLLEPVCDLTVTGGAILHAVETPPTMAPTMIDEIPILAVCALFAKGVSHFRGLAELRVKESDRLARILSLIDAAGGRAWTQGDDLYVEGLSGKVQPFTFDPAKDHRLAMAAAILAKRASGPCKVLDPACVGVSFPGFFQALIQADV